MRRLSCSNVLHVLIIVGNVFFNDLGHAWLSPIPKDFCEANELSCGLHEDIGQATEEEEVHRVKREFVAYRTGKVLSAQVSTALDKLLLFSGYDKRVRPQVGGPPVVITVNLSIRSMGPVKENSQVFSLDCYFRQSWIDSRLSYNSTGGVTELALNWAFLAKIWVPDTFFLNGKDSYLHKITVPNRFVRISPNGRVSYSQRLTVWADCPMSLKKYPLDSQMCPLFIGSFGYDANEIVYTWAAKPLSMDSLSMAQFNLTNYRSFELITTQYKRRSVHYEIDKERKRLIHTYRNDSVAVLEFFFQRQTGFFMLQIYTPLMLIVICSWISFWLVKTEKGGEVPARTVLGANAVLSVVNIGFGGGSRPQVGYMTAMDLFIIICFVAVFAAMIEFAFIVFIDQFIKKVKEKEKEKAEAEKKREEDRGLLISPLVMAVMPIVDATASVNPDNETAKPEDDIEIVVESSGKRDAGTQMEPEKEDDDQYEDILDRFEERFHTKDRVVRAYHVIERCYNGLFDRFHAWIERKYGPLNQTFVYNHTFEFIQSVDWWARRMFPFVFTLLMAFYWTFYLYVF